MYEGQNAQGRATQGPSDARLAQLGAATPGNGTRPSIPAILDEQSGTIVGLHKIISELENRLTQVLAHDQPSPEPANRIDPPPPTQISDRLAQHNHGIEYAQSRLMQLIQRLHL